MRARIIIIVLVLVCVLMGVALLKVSNQPELKVVDRERVRTITDFSNNLDQASAKLEEQRQVNIRLTNMLETAEGKAADLTQQTERLKGEVQRVSSELEDSKRATAAIEKAAKEAAKVAEQEIERRTAKIAELEKERETLTRTMEGLTNQIAILEVKIAETEKKLAAAEGQNDFLLKELARLRTEKAELERQFNDLKIVKEQVKKLTEENHIALRLEWMRKGLYNDIRGGERMTPNRSKPAATTNYNLDVELRRDAPPVIKSATNAPAPKK
jgi:chromosome segregation ATPase